jgi:demethylmenaquinone methyltransferase/2-methoxy-6-polyprenyl-1,4-benzoquinol methylase
MSKPLTDTGEPSPGDGPDAVDFGYRKVTAAEKTKLVGGVFSSVAQRYDVMNDFMSLGTHRLFKRMLVELTGARRGHRLLDLAGGTGDVAALLAPITGDSGQVVLADRNAEMMHVGRNRLLDRGHANVAFCQLNAEALPFASNSFDAVTLAFGIRNFTSKAAALKELRRVLKPGAALLVLEFSKPKGNLLQAAYSGFQGLWPAVGQALVGDPQPYRYLVESIRVHPDQKQLKLMMEDAGFGKVTYHNLLGGIAAIHRAEVAAS